MNTDLINFRYEGGAYAGKRPAKTRTYFYKSAHRNEYGHFLMSLHMLMLDLTNQDIFSGKYDVRRGFNHVWTTFIPFHRGDGEISVEFNVNMPDRYCKMYNCGLEIFLRGTEKGVESAFGRTIDGLGFPYRIEYPYLTSRIPLIDKIISIFDEENRVWTNGKGWKIAKKVIKDRGATLKAKTESICRFPYNLFIWDTEGKVIRRDGSHIREDFYQEKINAKKAQQGNIKKQVIVENGRIVSEIIGFENSS